MKDEASFCTHKTCISLVAAVSLLVHGAAIIQPGCSESIMVQIKRLVCLLTIVWSETILSFSVPGLANMESIRLNNKRLTDANASRLFHHGNGNLVDPCRFVPFTAASLIISIACTWTVPACPAQAASYSSNARNMQRLASGDSSGGSVYDNYPKSEAGKKRRAITGCKIPSARREASLLEGAGLLSEKDCNVRVLSGDTGFMLEAIRKLDCPTCPYGIDAK